MATVIRRPHPRDLGLGVVDLLLGTTHRADPYPLYRRLREHQPVHRTPFGLWLVSGHADATAALRHPGLSSELGDVAGNPASAVEGRPLRQLTALVDYAGPRALTRLGPIARTALAGPRARQAGRTFTGFASQSLLLRDPPDHTRLRRLVSRAFTPRVVHTLAPRIEQLTAELLDAAASTGTCEVISAFAYPLPLTIIGDLLGVPSADHHRLIGWSRALAIGLDPVQVLLDASAAGRADRAAVALTEYLAAILQERRTHPAGDLMSRLAQAAEGDDRLIDDEILTMCALLLIAGHETTVNLIGNGLVALLRHPDAVDQWLQQPELTPTAVEELLRFDSPAQTATRRATDALEIGGQQIPSGELVMILIGAANRDPDAFDQPDRLRLDRQPNHHLAFGSGIHHCLGATLARAEARIAIPAILHRRPRLQQDGLQWRAGMALRGLQSLTVSLAFDTKLQTY